jgi:ABC-type phosphate/phosphonate transport system substrate-binding protein
LKTELQVLATSPEVPENALVVRKGLDYLLKTKLKDVMLRMNQDKQGREILQEFGAQGFVETVASDYGPVFNFAGQIELDLNKYDYLTE